MEKKPEAESKGLGLIDVRDQKDKKLAIRITDKGAIVAVEQTLNAIVFISSILQTQKIIDVEELVGVLKDRLGKRRDAGIAPHLLICVIGAICGQKPRRLCGLEPGAKIFLFSHQTIQEMAFNLLISARPPVVYSYENTCP